jgi:hypothetical protein
MKNLYLNNEFVSQQARPKKDLKTRKQE